MMKTIKIKWCLLLSALTIFSFGLLPASVISETSDVDTHFMVDIVETSKSKHGAEEVSVTVKNIFNQTATNTVAKVALPEEFAKRLGKATVTENIGTLKAGASHQFLIRLSDGSIKFLPMTSEKIFRTARVLGLILLAIAGFVLRKRKILVIFIMLLILTEVTAAGASSYNHKATHGHQVAVAGQKLTFYTLVTGDFETENNSSSSSGSFGDSGHLTESVTTKFIVSFDLNGGESDNIPNQEVEENGMPLPPIDPSKTGYSFNGWYEIGTELLFDFTTKITKDTALIAQWVPIAYSIDYELDGGLNFSDAPSSYNIESPTITLGIPIKLGYNFEGWFTDPDATIFENTIAQGSIGNKMFYAKWTANPNTAYKVEHYKIASDGIATKSEVENKSGESGSFVNAASKNYIGYTYQANYHQNAYKTVASGCIAGDGSLILKLYYTENHTVKFNSNGGNSVNDITNIVSNAKINAPISPTKNIDEILTEISDDFIFAGWFKDSNLTQPFNFLEDTITDNITLYAKWKLPVIDVGSVSNSEIPNDFVGDEFDTVWLSNSWWRILKTDNGKALVVKEQVLGVSELGEAAESYYVQFDLTAETWNGLYFHDATTSTGYGESNLKSAIDTYYNTYIGSSYSEYVLPVDLNQPNWTSYSEAINFVKYDEEIEAIDYNNWDWGDDEESYYTNSRFATSLININDNDVGVSNEVNVFKKQAFALSLGDIQSLDKTTFYCNGKYGSQAASGWYTTLIDFYDEFWLRSAGISSTRAGSVDYGSFFDYNDVNTRLPIRPALWVTLDS
ncbi:MULTISPECIES: InlB B-repeat-containing protein [unclassified Enterococcus]|uniref:InlB B-repeat-containing protein n=1 Tax=unclassified Enterococcus TaxID=2608891 RepID=UPI0015561A01|nr:MULTISPECIES: InlB B-repeat-containing protein [unclassified Enterococcus]MBS7575954.1 InlB B-repeat-containing protein [Enterococcus sp. MMGLQ5-2]MBS7583187.1 InlB B-repeat-containing protein [Enterococcus sp. MMGLQ5-1]NPD11047.1 LPXTG cell wall anchor domain-containing protein [Enterococcus sp. MMGLQ5-1]NPD35790.1 LPXTG cell wall anchor domain-containing protein [Enterococcus sp. MMGLQ5-2]